MISEYTYFLKIMHERKLWKKEPVTEFVQGVIRGLTIALDLAVAMVQDNREVRIEYQTRINRWSAAEFHQDITMARNHLKNGDRNRALRRLEQALERRKNPG